MTTKGAESHESPSLSIVEAKNASSNRNAQTNSNMIEDESGNRGSTPVEQRVLGSSDLTSPSNNSENYVVRKDTIERIARLSRLEEESELTSQKSIK